MFLSTSINFITHDRHTLITKRVNELALAYLFQAMTIVDIIPHDLTVAPPLPFDIWEGWGWGLGAGVGVVREQSP